MSLSPEEKHKIYEEEKEREEAKQHIQREKQKKGCLGCFAVVVVIAIVIGIVSATGGGNSADSPDKIEAWVMTQQFVKDQLKAPATADYGSVWGGDYQDPDEVVTALGNDKFRISAWVDAENSFGANVRTYFVCELQYLGDDNWRCTKLDFVD